MSNWNILLVVSFGWSVLAATSHGQVAAVPQSDLEAFDAQTATVILVDTNAPKTKLEAFEAQTGTVIIRGTAQVGSVFAQSGTVSVRARESKDAGTGRKLYGIAIGIRENNRPEDTTILDYDELDSFLDGIDYVINVNRAVSALASFSAGYRTKGGLRIAAYSSSIRPGTVDTAVSGSRPTPARVVLTPDQLSKFQMLIQQAKTNLDALRTSK